MNSKVNINVIKNDLSNSVNYVKTLVPKSKETPKNINQVQKQVKKVDNFKKIGYLSKSFDNTLTKEIIHKKQQIIDMKSNENEDLNQSFNASKNKRSISVVHYFSSREKINRIELENDISCILEIKPEIFFIGNLIGKIILFYLNSLNEVLSIMEHHGNINSLFLLHVGAILSASVEKK